MAVVVVNQNGIDAKNHFAPVIALEVNFRLSDHLARAPRAGLGPFVKFHGSAVRMENLVWFKFNNGIPDMKDFSQIFSAFSL